MHLEILGTGTAVPSLRRLSSSYLLSTGSGRLLVDAGPSVVRRLLESGHTVSDVDTIILTHFHTDHTADLSTFLFACNYGAEERTEPLTIAGGKGLGLFYRRLARLYPWVAPNRYELRLRPMGKNTIRPMKNIRPMNTIGPMKRGAWRMGSLSITWAAMNHRDESIGVRIEEAHTGAPGRSVVFSGDTDSTPALAELASGADLLVVECAFPERKVKGHLNLEALLPIVRQARPGKVILSHLYPEWDDFRAPLPAPLLLGEDGMKLDI